MLRCLQIFQPSTTLVEYIPGGIVKVQDSEIPSNVLEKQVQGTCISETTEAKLLQPEYLQMLLYQRFVC